VRSCNVFERLSTFLNQQSALVLPQSDEESCSVRIVIREQSVAACMDLLQRLLFTEVDPIFFAAAESMPEQQKSTTTRPRLDRERKMFEVDRRQFALHGIRS
jgi:hypothetical protein